MIENKPIKVFAFFLYTVFFFSIFLLFLIILAVVWTFYPLGEKGFILFVSLLSATVVMGIGAGVLFVWYIRIRPIYLGRRGEIPEKRKERTRDFKISPSEAFELADPHLDESFRLRGKMRGEDRRENRAPYQDRPPEDHLAWQGDWYYVTRDNYPYKTFNGQVYLQYAVRVHIETGEVEKPKNYGEN